MLPLEKCLELCDKGFPNIEIKWGTYRFPSGDELLAECVKLLEYGQWIERHIHRDGQITFVREWCRVRGLASPKLHPIEKTVFECSYNATKANNNSDLADCWLWLNKRKNK